MRARSDAHKVLPVRHDARDPHVITPGTVSDDPLIQGRYDALFASMGPVQGLAPSIDSGGPSRVWLDRPPVTAGGDEASADEAGRPSRP